MNPDDYKILYDLKMYSKDGGKLFPDQITFIQKMFDNHPKEFSAIDKEINTKMQQKYNPLFEE